jgi:hypothetical protein
MYCINKETNTSPIIIHQNGSPASCPLAWKEAIKIAFNNKNPCCLCNNLSICTWNNSITPGILEKCLNKKKVPYHVLGKNTKWQRKLKLELNVSFLQIIKTPYILALDSYDVVVLSCPQDILKRFIKTNCDILFSAEKNSYPKYQNLTDFEKNLTTTTYPYLNSGAWIGKTSTCLKFFKESLKTDNKDILKAHPAPHIARDDQGITRKVFQKFYPRAKIDTNCTIFQSLYGVLEEEIIFGKIKYI